VAGSNSARLEQLFVWEEQGSVTRQLTRHDDLDASVRRPSISKSGDVIVFESTADLVPEAVDPIDSSRIGNPGGVRQIYRWRRGRGLDQLTWSDGDCFSPRMDLAGRFVLFASRGDPLSGGNPERNLEIFSVTPGASPARRLRQLTQTADGDSVLPRPTTRSSVFAFFSTAHPPLPDNWLEPVSPSNPRRTFGDGPHECTPQALLYDRGKVSHVHGVLDAENAGRFIATPSLLPVLTGPPVPSPFGEKVFLATNDYHLNPDDPDTGKPPPTTQLFAFFVAMWTRPGARSPSLRVRWAACPRPSASLPPSSPFSRSPAGAPAARTRRNRRRRRPRRSPPRRRRRGSRSTRGAISSPSPRARR
jgi:hypothetical protein